MHSVERRFLAARDGRVRTLAGKSGTVQRSSLALFSICCTITSADSFRLHFSSLWEPVGGREEWSIEALQACRRAVREVMTALCRGAPLTGKWDVSSHLQTGGWPTGACGRSTTAWQVYCILQSHASLRRAGACAGRKTSIFKHFIQSPEERFSHYLKESKQLCALVISFLKLQSPLNWDHGLWHLHLVMGKSDSHLDPLWTVRQLESFDKHALIGKQVIEFGHSAWAIPTH